MTYTFIYAILYINKKDTTRGDLMKVICIVACLVISVIISLGGYAAVVAGHNADKKMGEMFNG